MKRLTEYTRFHGSMLPVLNDSNRYSAIERLAAIEDILGDEYDLDRLRELLEADREGRVPKYTVGDTIYDRFWDKWEVDSAEFHRLKRDENPKWIYRCGHIGTDDYCALWEFEAFPSRDAALKAREQDEQ